MRKPLPILFLLLILAACGHDCQLSHVLATADSLTVVNADSSLRYLEAHESLTTNASKRQYMRFLLLKTIAQNRADVLFTSDSVAQTLVDYYETHGSANERMQVNYLLGRAYHDMQEAPLALHYYQDAVEKADTTQGGCDYYTLSAVYGQMAEIFHQQYLPHDELWALSKMAYYERKSGNLLGFLRAKELMIRPYFLMGETDTVVAIIKECSIEYKRHGYNKEAARTLPTLISILIDDGKYDEARNYMSVFEKHSGLFKSDNDTTFHGMYHYHKGRYMLQSGDIDSALINFNKLIGIYDEAAYNGILQVYQKVGIADSIAKYATLFVVANDSARRSTSSEIVHRMSAMYNFSRHQQLAEQREKELALIRRNTTISIALLLFTLCAITYIYKRYKKNKRKEIYTLTRNLIAAEEQLSKARKAQLLEKDIKMLTTQLDALRKEKAQVRKEDLEKAFFDTPVYKTFHHLSVHRLNQFPPTDSDWNEMNKIFAHHFPSYHSFIHDDNQLSPEQYRLAILVRLGFSSSEIGILMGKDKQRITNIKTAINQKIWSEKGAKTLVDHLKQHF